MKFFHFRMNARRKNHISRLKHNNGWVTDHATKEEIVRTHFSTVLGWSEPRPRDFNWDGLHFEGPDLDALGDPFTEEEVKNAIFQMPSDKAPGPDRKSTRLNSSHSGESRMPSSA